MIHKLSSFEVNDIEARAYNNGLIDALKFVEDNILTYADVPEMVDDIKRRKMKPILGTVKARLYEETNG